MNGGADDWMTCCDADNCNVQAEYPTKDDKRESPSLLLPPANEVWGKVMFLHLSVSHSVHRGVSVSVQGVSVQGGLCPGGLCPGGSLSRGGGLFLGKYLLGRPPYGNERVACILLECILVKKDFC